MESTKHYLNLKFSSEVGPCAALLADRLVWLCDNNQFVLLDNIKWINKPIAQWLNYFDYMTIYSIQKAFKHLVTHQYVLKGCYSNPPYHLTTWYTPTDLLHNNLFNLTNNKVAFNPDIAKDTNIHAAIVYNTIKIWCEYNASKNINKRDGYYWMYSSRSNLSDRLLLSDKVLKNAIRLLTNKKYIYVEHYSGGRYARTNWYRCIIRKGPKVYCEKGQTNKYIYNINNNIYNIKCIPSFSKLGHISSVLRVNQANNNPSYKEVETFIKVQDLKNINAADEYKYLVKSNWTDNKGNPIANWQGLLVSLNNNPSKKRLKLEEKRSNIKTAKKTWEDGREGFKLDEKIEEINNDLYNY